METNLLTSEKQFTDQQLWLAVRDSDEKAFAMLFVRYHGILYNYGCKLHTDANLIEDVIQDVFIDIWRLRANLTSEIISVKFYLYRAVRRRVHGLSDSLNMLMMDKLDGEIERNFTLANDEPAMIESESAAMLSQRIQSLITNLPPRQLEVLTLRYFDDFSVAEIASIMEITEKSVRNHLFKAISSLREHRDWLIISFQLSFFAPLLLLENLI